MSPVQTAELRANMTEDDFINRDAERVLAAIGEEIMTNDTSLVSLKPYLPYPVLYIDEEQFWEAWGW